MTDIEQLRKRVLDHKDYRKIANETGYAYDSLTKFAYGIVKDPGGSKLMALAAYFDKQDTDTAA